ncbi:MAG: SRPBCC family protein [Devosia sp.]|jgi:uncharacterized protein YndB with AHSA1/START domain
MSFDVAEHLGAIQREVRNTEKDGQPAKVVVASRVYETTPADLWEALTQPERLKRWFAPVSGDLKRGGRYAIEGNASGTVTGCEHEKTLALTWEFGGGISWVNLTLSREGSGTRLELEHVAHISPHWDNYGPGAVGVGWELSLLGLAEHLRRPADDVRTEGVNGWETSDEAKQLVRASSDGWGQGAIAAGEDRNHALNAAEATRRFYSGEVPMGG